MNAERLPSGYQWWKVVITAHIATDPAARGTLGMSRTLCGRSFSESTGRGPSTLLLGETSMFYPRCRRCLRSLAKRTRS